MPARPTTIKFSYTATMRMAGGESLTLTLPSLYGASRADLVVFSSPRGLFAGGAWMLNTTTLTLVTQKAVPQDVPVVVYVLSASGITLPAAGLLLDDTSFLVSFAASAGPVAPPIPIGRTRIVPRTAPAVSERETDRAAHPGP